LFGIPLANEGETGKLHIVLGETIFKLERILEITEPVFRKSQAALGDFQHHGLNAREASFTGDFDHVIEFVVITFACALHEPGVNFGTEFDVGHNWYGMVGV
ncbi:MAG: hypothetical protein RL693_941, partial [Verrucomicrobiota bacterium]